MEQMPDSRQRTGPEIVDYESFRRTFQNNGRAAESAPSTSPGEEFDRRSMVDWSETRSEMLTPVAPAIRDCGSFYAIATKIPREFRADDLMVGVDGNHLLVRGHNRELVQKTDAGGEVVDAELQTRTVLRKIDLPGAVVAENASGELDGTRLYLELPKCANDGD